MKYEDDYYPVTGQATYKCTCKQVTHITGLLYLVGKKNRTQSVRSCSACNMPMVVSKMEMHK